MNSAHPTRRAAFIATGLILFAMLVFVLTSPDPYAPQFKRLSGPPALPLSIRVSYAFWSPRPFVDGKMWILFFTGGTNSATLFYDIDRQQVLGQLTNGWPVLNAADPDRLVCAQPGFGVRERLSRLFQPVARRLFKTAAPPPAPAYSAEPQRYWLLDVEKNSAARIGRLPHWPETFLFSSPDSRFAYAVLYDSSKGIPKPTDLCLFDLKRSRLRKLSVLGWLGQVIGWWDNTHLLYWTIHHDLVLQEISTAKTASLLPAAQLRSFLRGNELPLDLQSAQFKCCWNGRGNDFYLMNPGPGAMLAESYLIKLEHPDGQLKLVSRHFNVEWSEDFDATGRYSLYSKRRDSTPDRNGVFLRDLQIDATQVLVAPNATNYSSLPRFYGDSVIYVRSNALWRINLDGTHNIRLFPPSER